VGSKTIFSLSFFEQENNNISNKSNNIFFNIFEK